MTYWVYMLANRRNGAIYVGVTSGLERRIRQHKSRRHEGFTATYDVDRLVWMRGYGDVREAIHFEKQLKRWRRSWKIRLIEAENPLWADLYGPMVQEGPLHPDLTDWAMERMEDGSRSSPLAKPG
ncbi:MAG: GIY-YIG nuclease family protein [Phenylobacterium sp.]|jgi:putative endonuclease